VCRAATAGVSSIPQLRCEPIRRTHPRGRMRPRPRYVSANAAVTSTDSPYQIGRLAQHACLGVRHNAMAVRRHCHPTQRCATVHLESAFPLAIMDPSTGRIIPCRTGTFTTLTAATHRASQETRTRVLRVIGRQGRGAVGTSDRQRRIDTPLGTVVDYLGRLPSLARSSGRGRETKGQERIHARRWRSTSPSLRTTLVRTYRSSSVSARIVTVACGSPRGTPDRSKRCHRVDLLAVWSRERHSR
jgi:hypothetical protein